MNQPSRILICGNYGATNLGDEAILQALLEQVRSAFPHANLQVVSANPELTTKQHGVEAVAMVPAGLRSFVRGIFGVDFRRTSRAFRDADLIIFGGGGLFTDEKPRAIFIWLMQILPALRRRKPVVCFGQSVGPLKSGWSRWIVRRVFRRMHAVVVRDEASRELLLHLGVRNVQVLPDPVFGLQKRFYADASFRSEPAERKPYIVFSLRPWKGNQPHEVLAKFVDWIFETYQLRTYFVPFQNEHDADSPEMAKVISKLQNRGGADGVAAAEIFPYNENIPDILKLMHEATAVVGMRLHSLIFSALVHTPFLGFSYSVKVSEVVRQLGMEDFLCEYRDLELEVLKKKFEKLFAERASIEKMLTTRQLELRHQTQKYGELLRGL